MKHKKPIFLFVVSMVIVGIITFPVFSNIIIHAIFGGESYYRIDYNINLSNREEIIDKVENLNYTAYLNDYYYSEYLLEQSYVDRALINYLKSRIENYTGFRSHYLRYSFLGENHSKLYLTYSNNTIFSLKNQFNTPFILKEDWQEPYWYLNFTHIPYVSGDSSTLELNELIFVKINLEYVFECGYVCLFESTYEQYLLLNKNLDILLIYVYYWSFYD